MKYRLRSNESDSNAEVHDEVCIGCGKRRPKKVQIFKMEDGTTIRPHTTRKITLGLGPTPGSRLGCMLGSHDYYLDYEVEPL